MTSQISNFKSQIRTKAFTLIEVVIASGIFFIAVFAIMGVMSQGLRAAGALKNSGPTAGMVLADLACGQMLEEGSGSGEFESYPDYRYTTNVVLFGTNGLFQVDVAVTRKGNIDSILTTYLYRPASKKK